MAALVPVMRLQAPAARGRSLLLSPSLKKVGGHVQSRISSLESVGSVGSFSRFRVRVSLPERPQNHNFQHLIAVCSQRRQGNKRKRKDKDEGVEKMVKVVVTATAAVVSSALLAATAVPFIAFTLTMLATLPLLATIFATVILPLMAVLGFFSIAQTSAPWNLFLPLVVFRWFDTLICVILLCNFLGGALSLWERLTKRRKPQVAEKYRDDELSRPSWAFPTILSFVPGVNGAAWLLASVEASEDSTIVRRGVLIKNALLYGLPTLWQVIHFSPVSQAQAGWLAMVLGAVHFQMERIRLDDDIAFFSASSQNKTGGKTGKRKLTEVDEEGLRQLTELERFDALLRERTSFSSGLSPEDWSTGDVMNWLKQEGLSRFATVFSDHDIDGLLLLQLTAEELRDELNISSLGERRRLLAAIAKLREGLEVSK